MMILGSVRGMAQVSLSNNLLYDASLTPNLSLEVGLAPKWSLQTTAGVNLWTFDRNKKMKHWLVQPELRRWFCQKFNGSFIAVHAMGGQFNAGRLHLPLGIAPTLRHHRYEGWYVGGGIAYGYQWPIAKHFSMEAEVGVGYDYIRYRKYPCGNCGTKQDDGHYNYFGPTKAALSVIYNF